jgi:hypothetical protein
MNQSLFIEYLAKYFPKLDKLIEKINGKRKGVTYLFKQMLTEEYSADLKWESSSINTSIVAADVVALDSELPLKKRDSIASANGDLPKIGMKLVLNEKQIGQINIMKARKIDIVPKLINDGPRCVAGVDERLEAAFLTGLAEGITLVEDADNVGTGVRVNYGYLAANQFGASTIWGETGYTPISDIKRVMAKAAEDHNSVELIYMATAAFDKIRNSEEGKQLSANYRGLVVVDAAQYPIPSREQMTQALADEFSGVKIVLVDRTIVVEKNGVKHSIRPFGTGKLVFLPTENVGRLVYGTLAEETNPVSGVLYSKANSYTLVSKYSKNDPLREFTSSQAMVLPVIDNVDLIYTLDINEAQVLDTVKEAADATDVKVTIWGVDLTKATVITKLKEVGVSVANNASDATVIKKVNELTDEQEATLKAALGVS